MKILNVNEKTYYVWQTKYNTLLITENGYKSIPNAGLFIKGMGGIQAVLDACHDVDDPVDDGKEHGCIVSYVNNTGRGNLGNNTHALVHDVEEAIEAIESWHTYNNAKYPMMKVTDNARHKLEECFQNQDKRFKVVEFRTSGCGCWDIVVSMAKADTILEHYNIGMVEQQKARDERKAKAMAEFEKKMLEMHDIRRGWYSVSLTFQCYEFNPRRGMVQREKTFSGCCIASSQMDAYHKSVENVKRTYTDLDIYEWGEPTNENYFYALFLGMKTDDGYSISAWEDFAKTDEYKASVENIPGVKKYTAISIINE